MRDRSSTERKFSLFHLRSGAFGTSSGNFFSVYKRIPTPETNCERTVAKAAPFTPNGKTATQRISSVTLRTADAARKISGTVELPTARKTEAK